MTRMRREKSALCRKAETGNTFRVIPMKTRLVHFVPKAPPRWWSAVMLVTAMLAELSTTAGTVQPNSSSALTNWQSALLSFRAAGAAIGKNNYPQAQAELSHSATNLPAPYNAMAAKYLDGLNSALNQFADAKDPRRQAALIKLCGDLRAYGVAIHLGGENRSTADPDDDPVLAWRLFESGDLKAAAKEYQRKLEAEFVDTWQDYYRTQLRLIEQRPTNLTSVSFALEFIKQHYLKGFEEKADQLGALQELTRVLPFAQSSKEKISIYQSMIKMLSGLGDDAGRDAWESKLLTDFGADPAASASVHLARGLRAYAKTNYAEALSLLHQACSEDPNSDTCGDAQYSIGTLFLDQQKYDEAIAEFLKLIASGVKDYTIDVDSSDDYRNYRYRSCLRLSDCYEAKKEFPKALEYAELARDRYKHMSYCSSCVKSTRESLEKRITRLKETVKKVP